MNNAVQNQSPNYIEEDEIDLRELFFTIKKHALKIVLFSIVVTSFTLLYALSKPNIYASKTVLEAEDNSGGSSLGGLGALAGFAGINIGGGKSDTFSSLSTILDDYNFHISVIQKYELDKKLSTELDTSNYVFALGYRGIFDILNSKKEKDEKADINDILFSTYKNISKDISLNQDKKSGMITLEAKNSDRFLAKELVSIYLKELTSFLKNAQMKDIEKKLSYYKKELASTNDIQLKENLSKLVSSLIQKEVLSKSNELYNVSQVTKEYIPNIKDKQGPKRGLIVVVAFVTSIILGIFGVFFIEFIRNSKEESKNE